jgi:hypothetical protein
MCQNKSIRQRVIDRLNISIGIYFSNLRTFGDQTLGEFLVDDIRDLGPDYMLDYFNGKVENDSQIRKS